MQAFVNADMARKCVNSSSSVSTTTTARYKECVL